MVSLTNAPTFLCPKCAHVEPFEFFKLPPSGGSLVVCADCDETFRALPDANEPQFVRYEPAPPGWVPAGLLDLETNSYSEHVLMEAMIVYGLRPAEWIELADEWAAHFKPYYDFLPWLESAVAFRRELERMKASS